MPLGELRINGDDAFTEYGLSISDGGKAILMCPAPNKDRARNSSRLRHGSEIAGTLERKDSRELSLPVHITASNSQVGLDRFNRFCAVLDAGTVDLELAMDLPGVIFKCKYINCTNFMEFRNQMFKFTLKLEEPNPNDRSYGNI